MTEPTTAEERAAWLEEFPERVTPYNTRPLGQILAYADARRLIADVERLEKERDKLRDKLLEIAKGNCGSFQHDIPTFLDGLSTDTPEEECAHCGSAGVCNEDCPVTLQQRRLSQRPCERVCVPGRTGAQCATHHGPWGECPAAVAGNVTT